VSHFALKYGAGSLHYWRKLTGDTIFFRIHVESRKNLSPIKMRFRIHKRAVAWLGLMAMLLVVLMPLASQLIASAKADNPLGAICSAVVPHSAGHADSDSPAQLDACGYCNFFGHYVSAPTTFVSPQLFVRVVVAIAPISTVSAFLLLSPYPSGRPRDPPSIF
jgi:hypothetical protein